VLEACQMQNNSGRGYKVLVLLHKKETPVFAVTMSITSERRILLTEIKIYRRGIFIEVNSCKQTI